MDLIILSGNAPENKEWAEKVGKLFKDEFDSIYIQYYEHWPNQKKIIDFNLEISKLVKNNRRNLIIIAKSVGVALAIKCIHTKKLNPLKCVFFGLPIKWCEKNNIPLQNWLINYKRPSLFIQQTEDPFLSFSELKPLLEKLNVKNYSLYEVNGNDHIYLNIKKLKNTMEKFIF